MSFKIIAIKTGKSDGISQFNFLDSKEYIEVNYLKNLRTETIYCFNSHYSLSKNDDNNFTEIKYDRQNDIELYALNLKNRTIPVNITAIAGKNGCGKSTLIELLYWIKYNIGCKLGLLKGYLPYPKLDLELLYRRDKDEYRILKFSESIDGEQENDISFFDFTMDKGEYTMPIHGSQKWNKFTRTELSDFFYSIVINYSFYALNTQEIGLWIEPLFHKNDGYQTPIVLNPMRTEGNIDVNRERELLSRRLQSNIFEPLENRNLEDSLRNLANGKIATTLEIKYNEYYRKSTDKSKQAEYDEATLKAEDIKQVVSQSLETVFGINKNGVDCVFWDIAILYICLKLRKMTERYPEIYEQIKDNGSNIENLFKDIKTKNSHTTFKIKGAILHLKYYNEIYKNYARFSVQSGSKPTKHPFTIDIEAYASFIKNIQGDLDFPVNTYMMAFPSFFKVTIQPKKKEEGTNILDNIPIDTFSSGEKQKINGLTSIVYHILNLNSVEKEKSFTPYKYINIVLDEIELYYHPEWQRTFIADMLDYLGKINPENVKNIEGVNIILVTHSPFILSDIPKSNILFLEDGKVANDKVKTETFGANLYDLMLNGFFLKNTFGEFATKKIEEIIENINNRNSENPIGSQEFKRIDSLIDIVGDPFYKQELRRMLIEKTDNNEYKKLALKKQSEEINMQLKKLENK